MKSQQTWRRLIAHEPAQDAYKPAQAAHEPAQAIRELAQANREPAQAVCELAQAACRLLASLSLSPLAELFTKRLTGAMNGKCTFLKHVLVAEPWCHGSGAMVL